ncbi:hypothetical protein DSO57_1008647 [Entomophthora muscae]|uniref:Uncharacterized protein n=1 Tax=Entomophthora muscae TaxID=34485 RepID=A0ACC2SKG2_9FUNG|nr:hypothetical protein DSO57_1008647 [Entomophthora muscae]
MTLSSKENAPLMPTTPVSTHYSPSSTTSAKIMPGPSNPATTARYAKAPRPASPASSRTLPTPPKTQTSPKGCARKIPSTALPLARTAGSQDATTTPGKP